MKSKKQFQDGLHTTRTGNRRYYKDGKLHREDGPAVINYGKIRVGEEEHIGIVYTEWRIKGMKTFYSTLCKFEEHHYEKINADEIKVVTNIYYRDPRLIENINYFEHEDWGNRTKDGKTYTDKETTCKEVYLYNGCKHRVDGPALMEYGVVGKGDKAEMVVREESWYYQGGRHRIGGPAIITIHGTNGVGEQAWFVDGKIHREDGPASITFNSSEVMCENWYLNGKRHRMDGPAIHAYKLDEQGNKFQTKSHTDYYYIKGHVYTKEAFNKRRIKGFLETI